MKNSNKLIVLIFLSSLILSGCGIRNKEEHIIKVGVSPVCSSSGIFIAYGKGYFKELGLNIEMTNFESSGAPMTMLLSKGKLDVGAGNLTASLCNALNQGLDIKLVADKGHIEKDHSYIALIVRQDHINSGRYKSFIDLKGFKMALTSLNGVSQQIAAEKFLSAGGLKLTDVEFL